MRTFMIRMSTLLIGLTLLTTGAAPTSAAGLKFTQISAGDSYVCGVTMRGEIYCAGLNGNGQLGDGTKLSRDSFVRVNSAQRFAKVFSGATHTCAITQRGQAYCWGYNNHGQLGDGTRIESLSPVLVTGSKAVTEIAINGPYSTCATTTNGSSYCWGYNGETGYLGNGGLDEYATQPTPVVGGLRFKKISAQEDFTCGLTSRGDAYCWGSNSYGAQLGIGSDTPGTSAVPLSVVGGLRYTDIEVASDAACGLTANGRTYCWGLDDAGSLGGADISDSDTPVLVLGGIRFSALSSAGGEDHICALTARGAAYCWGGNSSGQLGTGNGDDSDERGALPVAGSLRFSMVSVNEYTSCGLTTRGQVWCWGGRAGGTLYSGSDSDVPVLVD